MEKSIKSIRRKAPDVAMFEDIPKYWFDGNPFATRFFDAMSLTFPEGEKFFIRAVKAFANEVKDPDLKNEIEVFVFQEAQHMIAHRAFNDRLQAQGLAVDKIDSILKRVFTFFSNFLSAKHGLAVTASAEHLTAIMSHVWAREDIHRTSDPRMRALYYWHGFEEIEHKSVAFDVMQKIAGAGYIRRVLALLTFTVFYAVLVATIIEYMLRADGLGFFARIRAWGRGMVWFWGRNGAVRMLMPAYAAYFRRDFHPWQEDQMDTYKEWLKELDLHGDIISAAQAVSRMRAG